MSGYDGLMSKPVEAEETEKQRLEQEAFEKTPNGLEKKRLEKLVENLSAIGLDRVKNIPGEIDYLEHEIDALYREVSTSTNHDDKVKDQLVKLMNRRDLLESVQEFNKERIKACDDEMQQLMQELKEFKEGTEKSTYLMKYKEFKEGTEESTYLMKYRVTMQKLKEFKKGTEKSIRLMKNLSRKIASTVCRNKKAYLLLENDDKTNLKCSSINHFRRDYLGFGGRTRRRRKRTRKQRKRVKQ
jgi:chromosome segregation ATPase